MNLSSCRSGLRRAVVLAALASDVCATSAAAQGPALSVDALSNTSAPAGGTLQFVGQVTSVGGADTDGSTIDLRVMLAPHLTAVSVTNVLGSSFTCTAGDGSSPVAGATTLDCRRRRRSRRRIRWPL